MITLIIVLLSHAGHHTYKTRTVEHYADMCHCQVAAQSAEQVATQYGDVGNPVEIRTVCVEKKAS